MTHLIQSIILCLLAAVVLGFILGWLFRAMMGRPISDDRAQSSRANVSTKTRTTALSDEELRAGQVRRSDFIFVDR